MSKGIFILDTEYPIDTGPTFVDLTDVDVPPTSNVIQRV